MAPLLESGKILVSGRGYGDKGFQHSSSDDVLVALHMDEELLPEARLELED